MKNFDDKNLMADFSGPPTYSLTEEWRSKIICDGWTLKDILKVRLYLYRWKFVKNITESLRNI